MDNENWPPVQPLGNFESGKAPSGDSDKILDNPVVVRPGSADTPRPRSSASTNHSTTHASPESIDGTLGRIDLHARGEKSLESASQKSPSEDLAASTFAVHDVQPTAKPQASALELSQPSASSANVGAGASFHPNANLAAGQPLPMGAVVVPMQPGVAPAQVMFTGPMQPGMAMPGMVAPGMTPAGTNAAASTSELDLGGLIKTIVIVVLSLAVITFISLFIWRSLQYDEISTDVNGQIATAVAEAQEEQALKDEAEFAEREKYPYRTFSGPADYGQLTFEYPKTWSVYVASDASKGGDYHAYLNPIEVNVVSNTTINALRVTILDKAFDDVAAEYQRYLDRKDSNLSVESVTVAGVAANRYTGTIPDTELSGIIVIFKIRDKTAILQTDSVLFTDDFNRLLSTVEFNA